ncbi:TetR family transcriptional regulator [Nocardioides sp. 616]|uniref:TetR family transcriptional regulator n=1 Tax=Nocardioides sp. 616 TaxID=2268090 RepID=UPI000CE3BD19|nr:TetR family transcriptional regulator [Nocardioides sp. 616]
MTSPAAAPTLQQRLVATAVELTTAHGWSHVTMARLAREVGVSRQTVYDQIGTKQELAEAVISTELARFLDAVTRAFDRSPGDLVAAVEGACHDVLVLAQDNALLRAIVSATHGTDTELLPLLTTHSATLLQTAQAVVAERVAQYDVPLDPARLAAGIEVIVRVVLSHVMQPSGTPAQTAADLSWIAGRVLATGEGRRS